MAPRHRSRGLPREDGSARPARRGPAACGKMPTSFSDAKLGQGTRELARVWRAIVPEELVFHEAHALALDRMRDHTTRPAFDQRNGGERLEDFVDVMAVDLAHRPSESFPFQGERLEVEYLLHGPKALNLVVVDNRDEVI